MTSDVIDFEAARVYAIPMTTQFRGITIREGMLIQYTREGMLIQYTREGMLIQYTVTPAGRSTELSLPVRFS